MDLFNENIPPFNFPSEKQGYKLEFDPELSIYTLTIPNGKLLYSERFFDKKVSDRSLEYFLENDSVDWKNNKWQEFNEEKLSEIKFKNIKWRHDKIKLYGKEIFLPRFSAWYGDDNKPYTYSGLTLHPNKWNKGLLYIKDKIEKISNCNFNSVLMNWYRDGEDYISWHTDAEKELGQNPTIGSVNFGETRRFLIRRIYNYNVKLEFPLKHGTLLIMSGELQHFWQHSVPKQKGVKNSRVNLTFREII